MDILDLLETGKNFLRIIGPLAIFAVGIVTTWGIVKWAKTMGRAMKELAESPFSLMFAVVVVALLMFFYFAYVDPLLR